MFFRLVFVFAILLTIVSASQLREEDPEEALLKRLKLRAEMNVMHNAVLRKHGKPVDDEPVPDLKAMEARVEQRKMERARAELNAQHNAILREHGQQVDDEPVPNIKSMGAQKAGWRNKLHSKLKKI